jgi:hypothetical protein
MKIMKKNGNSYIQLPDEFSQWEDVELFKLKDGYYLLTVPLGKPKAQFKIPNEAEKKVLKRLLSIKFQNRTPAYVNNVLSPEEKDVLKQLEEKKFINVFRGRKYPQGVYNINDKIYATLYGKKTVGGKPAQAAPQKKENPADTLDKKGYAVGTSQDLKGIIDKNKTAIKSGRIKGLKGFDGRFYIARMDYISKMSSPIIKQLDKEKSIDEIAENLKVEPDAVRTVLHILAEAGDVIEKRKGVYAAI